MGCQEIRRQGLQCEECRGCAPNFKILNARISNESVALGICLSQESVLFAYKWDMSMRSHDMQAILNQHVWRNETFWTASVNRALILQQERQGLTDSPPVSPIQLINELKATRLSYTRLQTKQARRKPDKAPR